MKIRNAIIAGVVTAASIAVFVPATTTKAAECSVGSLGGDHTQTNVTVNGTTAHMRFAVKGDANCKQDVVFASWEAPSLSGLPFNEQKLYDFTTGTYGVGIHEITVDLPVCETNKNILRYYQADMLRGTNPTNANGGADYGATGEGLRLIDWKHGGQECPEPVKPVKKPVKTPAPEALPVTGAASIIAPALVTGTLAGVVHNLRQRRK